MSQVEDDIVKDIIKTKNVLIVDDSPDILCSLGYILENKGFEVITANNGKECLNIIEKGFKGVMVLDIMMPGMDGWGVVHQIVKDGYVDNNIKIIIMTAVGTPNHDKLRGVEPYIQDYMYKPFIANELVYRIKQLI